MKNILTFLIFFAIIGCGKDKNVLEFKQPIAEFLTNPKILTKVEISTKKPIQQFRDFAEISASKRISINKANINESFDEAQNYNFCIVLVANHTLVKVEDFKTCTPSASWGVCMPKVSGYIKKRQLQYQNDFMNNVIGLPDNQERYMYLFEKK